MQNTTYFKLPSFCPDCPRKGVAAFGFLYQVDVWLIWPDLFQISVLEFSRDRKMMSVLCSRKQMEIMFSKGAPESILSRCTAILCNDDGSTVPLSAAIRAELELRFHRWKPLFKYSRICCLTALHTTKQTWYVAWYMVVLY